jgi:hypothetical protein
MRTICPQVSGIYENNNNADPSDPYTFLMLKKDEPLRELISTNAFKVNLSGEIDPNHKNPLDCFARDFGDFIKPICRPIDNELFDALDLVFQLASSNCLDNEYDVENSGDEICYEIATECRRQRAALNLVNDYLAKHPLVV